MARKQIKEFQDQLKNFDQQDARGILDTETAKKFVHNLTIQINSLKDAFAEMSYQQSNYAGAANQMHLSSEQNAKNKMQMSLMRRQLQQDYISKVKKIIQNQLLKKDEKRRSKRFSTSGRQQYQTTRLSKESKIDMDDLEQQMSEDQAEDENNTSAHDLNNWDTPKMRQIIRQLIPLGDIVLDDEFFESSPMKDFQPIPSMKAVILPCQVLMKLIQNDLDSKISNENTIFEMTASNQNQLQIHAPTVA